MKILLLGKNGQIGWELQRALPTLGEVIAVGRNDLDLVNREELRSLVRRIKPDLIINAAAYTDVEKAEKETELAILINGIIPGILAEESVRINARIVHYSTDYVFDGTKGSPYREEDPPNPLNIYGKTKLAGEQAIRETNVPHLIFRTSWVYGLRGNNFLLKILRLAFTNEEMKIVNDQFGAPTWSRTVAEATAQALKSNAFAKDKVGVYHLSAAGEITWYQFARAILTYFSGALHKNPKLYAISTAEFKCDASRPYYSCLLSDKVKRFFNISMPNWDDSLKLALQDIEESAHAQNQIRLGSDY